MTARRTHISIFGKDYPIPPKGLYAGVPGKGPEGKQCRHCDHRRRLDHHDAQSAQLGEVLEENKRLRAIEAAARNLCEVRGRHHSEIAMRRLIEALTPNVRSQATDAALSRQVACTDGVGVGGPTTGD